MIRKAKKGWLIVLSALLLLSNLTIMAEPASADESPSAGAAAAYVGIDNATKGHWNGKYGTDGYILFGYQYKPAPDAEYPIRIDPYTHDSVVKPAYLDEIAGHAYSLNGGTQIRVRELPTGDALANILDVPAGSGLSSKIESAIEIGDSAPLLPGGHDNGGRRSLTFHVNDDEEHLFTVYSTKELRYKYFAIEDLEGNQLMPLTKGDDLFQAQGIDSSYVSFKVKGGFTFHYDGQWENIGLQGAFFDPYAPYGLTATAENDGSISLAWGNRPGASSVIVERSSDGESFAQVATLAGNAAAYNDADGALLPEHEYTYRLRYGTGAASQEASATTSAAVSAEDPRIMLLTDTATSGQWEGKYGSDGYVLVGYGKSVVPKTNEWSTIQALPSNDLQQLPEYLESYAYEFENQLVLPPLTDSDRYYGYTLDMPSTEAVPSPDPDAVVAGESRKKYKAYARMNKAVGAYTFILNDDEEHVFSLTSRQRETVKFQLTDLEGRVLSEKTIDQNTFTNTGYVSFLVKGSFKIVIHTPSSDFGATGFFFDEPLNAKASDVEASLQPGRTALLEWVNNGSPNKLILERKKDNGSYTQLAVLNGTETSYSDQNLSSGSTYYYRLRNVSTAAGTDYGSSTTPVSVELPVMIATALTVPSSEDIQTVVGGEITLNTTASFSGEEGQAPLEDATVTFRLRGGNVGAGNTFGEEIPEVLGTAVTDENGIATLTLATEFPGQYEVVATLDPDDIRNLDSAESEAANLIVSEPALASPPQVFKLSDAVKPGKLLTINGYGLTANDELDIAMERDTVGSAPATPGDQALHPEIVQTDRSGFFAVVRMPADAEPGVYNVWVKNDFGWSVASKLNAARPLFISDYEAFNGIDIDLAGRNFDAAEFGGVSNTLVRLNDGEGSTFPATVKKLNPYGLTLTVGEADLGTYDIEVSNDGGNNWNGLTNGQSLTIVEAGDDPLGLGVAWAKDFAWDNVFNVTDEAYGATGDDETNDTDAVQAAVEAAGADGGVVYFPDGDYYIDTITLPSGVVLQGESTEGTKLFYTGSEGVNFVNTFHIPANGVGVPERQGVANLSLLLADQGNRPDAFMWLGERWGDSFSNKALRTGNRLFVTGVKIDYPTDSDKTVGGRGLGLEFIAQERVLVKDNHFVGYHAQPFINAISQYYLLKDNYFEFTKGYIVGVSMFAFYEGNHVKAVHSELKQETHGLFARSNAYIAGNIVENMGDISNAQNDGESIAVEVPGGRFNYGKVLKGSADEILVSPVKPLTTPTLEYGLLSVLIVDGKGAGQLRTVSEIDGYTIRFNEPFSVAPDSTSKFTLITPNDNATIHSNTVRDNAKGIWLFGNTFDSIVANNVSENSEGIFMWTDRSNEGLTPGYFTRIVDNDVSGISRRSFHGGIGFNTGRSDNNKYYAMDVYSTEILDNKLSGDNTVQPTGGRTEAPGYGGIYAIAATHSSQYDGVPGTGDATNTIIEGNKLSDLGTGVDLTHSNYGQVVTGNTYDETVLEFLKDTGSVNTLIEDNSLVETPAPTPTPSSGPSEPTPSPTPTPTTAPGTVQVKAETNGDGKATANVGSDQLKAAIGSASKTLTIDVSSDGETTAFEINVAEDAVDDLLSSGLKSVKLQTPFASVTLSPNLLKDEADPLQLTITAVDTATLPEGVRNAVGNHPVYDFNLLAGGKKIEQFGKGLLTVELPYQLQPGDHPNHIVIYYIGDDGELTVVKNGKYDAATSKVSFSPKHFSLYAAASRKVAFSDTAALDWAKAEIEGLAARGVVQGVGESKFNPGGRVTRAEFLTMLMNALDLVDPEASHSFSDVEQGKWYTAAVSSAKQLGISNGRPDGTFGVNDEVTRQDMAVMINRAAAAAGYTLAPAGQSVSFSDVDSIAGYARDSVETLRGAGLIEGLGNGTFAPQGAATRAQAAVLIWRLLFAE